MGDAASGDAMPRAEAAAPSPPPSHPRRPERNSKGSARYCATAACGDVFVGRGLGDLDAPLVVRREQLRPRALSIGVA